MTNSTLTPRPLVVRLHYAWLGLTKMVCIQPNCDGQHHVYCNCRCGR